MSRSRPLKSVTNMSSEISPLLTQGSTSTQEQVSRRRSTAEGYYGSQMGDNGSTTQVSFHVSAHDHAVPRVIVALKIVVWTMILQKIHFTLKNRSLTQQRSDSVSILTDGLLCLSLVLLPDRLPSRLTV